MKTFNRRSVTVLSFCLVNLAAYSQGTVNFDTKAVGARVFYDVEIYRGGSPIGGFSAPMTGNHPGNNLPFYGQLYAASGAGAAEATLQPVGTPLTFLGNGDRNSPNAGYLQDLNPVAVVPLGGGSATVQLRAWTGAETYELAAAMALVGAMNAGAGSSGTLDLHSTGNPNAEPPITQVDLIGLQGFYVETGFITIPEPSIVALFASGLIFLGFSRRGKKKSTVD